MPLKQIQFQTSSLTGTGKPKKAGESLAGILVNSARLASAIGSGKRRSEADKEREERKLSLEEDKEWNYVLASDKNDFTKRWNEAEANGELQTSDEKEAFINSNNKNNEYAYYPAKSTHETKWDSFLNNYGKDVTNSRIKERNLVGENMITSGISDLNMSDFASFQEVEWLSGSAKEMNQNINMKNTIDNLFGYTVKNMERDKLSGKLEGMTKDELIEQYGGTAFKEVKDKNSKGYLLFEDSINKISKELKEEFNLKSVAQSIDSEVDTTSVFVGAGNAEIDNKTTMKMVNAVINKSITDGDVNKAIRVSNQYRASGNRVEVMDNAVNNMFMTGQPDKNGYDLYHSTKNTYAYKPEVVSNMNLLTAVSEVQKLDLNNPDEFKASLDMMKIAVQTPLNKKSKVDIDEMITSTTLGFGLNDSEQSFFQDKVKLYHKAGLSVKDAYDFAQDEYDKYAEKTNSDQPYGMFAENEKQAEIMLKSFSSMDSTEDVTMSYYGQDKWRIAVKGHGVVSMSNTDLSRRMSDKLKIENTKNSFNLALTKTGLSGTDAQVKKVIRKKAENEVLREHPEVSKDKKKRDKLVDIMIHDGLNAIEEAEQEAKNNEVLNFFGLNY